MKNNESRFVILEHRGAEGVHWDLMLEDAGALLTWRLDVPPEQIGTEPVPAEEIHQHPLRFLDYQGAVQQNTGTVARVDKGLYAWVKKEENAFAFLLRGHVLLGSFELTRKSTNQWVLLRRSDSHHGKA